MPELKPWEMDWSKPKEKKPWERNWATAAEVVKKEDEAAQNLQEGVARYLNVPGGTLTAATLGGMASLQNRNNPEYKSTYLKDVVNALKGERIPAEKYLERMGYAPSTGRKFLGTSYDVLADLAAGAGIGRLAEVLGVGAQRVPYAAEDIAAWSEGKKPVSPILKRRGNIIAVSEKGKLKNIEKSLKQAESEVAAAEAPIKEMGQNPDVMGDINAAYSKAQEHVDRLKLSGSEKDRIAGAELQKIIDAEKSYYEGNPPTYEQLKDINQSANRNYQVGVPRTKNQDTFARLEGIGTKEEMNRLAEQASPGSSNVINAGKSDISSLLTALPKTEESAIREARKKKLTQIDLMSLIDPVLFGLKQAGKVAGTPAPWTIGGTALEQVGKYGKYAPIGYTPWLEFYNKNKEEK